MAIVVAREADFTSSKPQRLLTGLVQHGGNLAELEALDQPSHHSGWPIKLFPVSRYGGLLSLTLPAGNPEY